MLNDVFSASPENPHANPVVTVIGNNDVQPHNYIKLNDDALFFFEQLWDHWIPKHQRKDFLKGGYFAVDVAPGLRVLSMNTMFFLKKNPLAKACQKQGSFGSIHLERYQQQLEKARLEGVKVYVIGHVPPSSRDFFKSCLKDYIAYMPTVRIYRYEYRNVSEAKHEYGTLLGYAQYVANISRYNKEDIDKDSKPQLNYELEYDTKESYGLADQSIDTYLKFTDTLTKQVLESEKLWSTYCQNIFVQTMNHVFE